MKKTYPLNVHEFGKQNEKIIVLIHPSIVRWDYFMDVIPLLEKEYHLMIPALPGYDLSNDGEFTSVEEVAAQIVEHLKNKNIDKVDAVYGCSMGGSIALCMATDHRITIDQVIMDGGITPYQLPWLITRFILLRDFGMVALGKIGGEKMIAQAFPAEEYGEEFIRYAKEVLDHMSYRTIWRTFDSCNNYTIPLSDRMIRSRIHYWYGEQEAKERNWDIRYMRKFFPSTRFVEMAGIGHAALAPFHPKRFVKEILKVLK